MKKQIFVILGLMLMTTSVMATTYSVRGYEGDINYIGSDQTITPSKVHFSAWRNGVQGSGGLSVIGNSTSWNRIVLNVGFDSMGNGFATYWKTGQGRPIRFPVHISYDFLGNSVNVIGTGIVNFRLSNIPVA